MRKFFLILVLAATYAVGNSKPIQHQAFFSAAVLQQYINDDNTTAIYNNAGVLVAWINDNIIYDTSGRQALAFIDGENVFSFGNNAKYLGRFHKGFFWDKVGNAIAWVKGASGGPITPNPLERVAPVFIPVIKPITPILLPRIDFIESLGWSVVSWDEFIK